MVRKAKGFAFAARVDAKGRVTLPKGLRRRMGLAEGSEVAIRPTRYGAAVERKEDGDNQD